MGAALAPRTRFRIVVTLAFALVGRLVALAAAWSFVAERGATAVALGVAASAIFIGRRVATTVARIDVERDLSTAAARALLEADVIEEPVGEPHFALTNGIFYATDAATSTLPSFGGDLVASLAAVVLLIVFVPGKLLAAALVGAAMIGLGTLALRSRLAKLHETATRMHEALAEALGYVLHGRLEIVAAGTEPYALGRVRDAGDAFVRAAQREAFGSAILGRVPVGAAIVAAAGTIALGGWAESMTLLAGLKTGALFATALPPLLSVVFGVQEVLRLKQRLAPFERIVLRPPRADQGRAGTPMLPAEIVFDDVSFAYGDGALALEHRSFTWPDGVVVLRGSNGSGKTTLLRLLLGLREPRSGRIRIGETDLSAIDPHELRMRAAYVPQRPFLGDAHTSIEEAVRWLVPGIERSAIERALDRTGLLEPLRRVARGEDVLARPIGELSGGQRQRLALARALCKGAQIVLLDEPDVNLDREGLHSLLEAIRTLRAEGKMVAVAAHGPIGNEIEGRVWDLDVSQGTPTVGHVSDG
jgi:ABC-type multidrug transport system fused ATPase/permease subunit